MIDRDKWQGARLIPVSGIRGEAEQERRGCSALLAVLGAVHEFGRAVLGPLGAPAGRIATYVEVPFEIDDRRVRPDGVIEVTRANRTWTALVEVKAGTARLESGQINDYLEVACRLGFDAVLTISNEIAAVPGEHPARGIDSKKLRKVRLAHLSWSQIHTEALVERQNQAISDRDQAWILDELVRYLEHDNSGAVDFQDMGERWVHVREGAAKRSLSVSDRALPEVVARYEQLIAFAAMRLSRRLGVYVQATMSRADVRDATKRAQSAIAQLVHDGSLTGQLRIPHAASELAIRADLRAGMVTCTAEVDAPTQRQQATRVRWLVRQLNDAPDDLLISASVAYQRAPNAPVELGRLREASELLVLDKSKEIRRFQLALSSRAGSKRGAGRGSFIDSVLLLTEAFYASVLQDIKPWTQPAPVTHEAGDGASRQAEHIVGELPPQTTPREPVPVNVPAVDAVPSAEGFPDGESAEAEPSARVE